MFTPIKPRFRDYFRNDLENNLLNRYGTVHVPKQDIMTECVMYSCDMCLEFQRKSDGLLSQDWIEHITMEVGEALKMITLGDFDNLDTRTATDRVKTLMRMSPSSAQNEVDRYYNRI